MKTTKIIKGILLLAAVLLFSNAMQAQYGKGMMNKGQGVELSRESCMISDLTDAQKEQIQKIRTSHLKEMQTFRNQSAENRARYRTLMTADKADQKAIDANIDEFTKLRNQMMKKQAAHHQSIRSLLTDEQKVHFDNRGMKMRQGMGKQKSGMKGFGRNR